METVVAAFISAAVTLLVCIINNNSQHSKTRALLEYKLEELTRRVDKHNNVIERTYQLERNQSVIKEQIKDLERRVEA